MLPFGPKPVPEPALITLVAPLLLEPRVDGPEDLAGASFCGVTLRAFTVPKSLRLVGLLGLDLGVGPEYPVPAADGLDRKSVV